MSVSAIKAEVGEDHGKIQRRVFKPKMMILSGKPVYEMVKTLVP